MSASLKLPAEMARLFGSYPESVARTYDIVEGYRFSLDELAYQYPEARTLPGLSPALEKLTWEGAAIRYPNGHFTRPAPRCDTTRGAA